MKPIDTVEDAGGASEHAAFARLDARTDHHLGDATAAVPDAALLFSGAYHQSGNDLVITRPFETVTIHDYFRYDEKPSLVAPDGSSLSGAVVVALTEGRPHTQYAGDDTPARGTAIGRVETATGTATVVRNGQTVTLHPGDLVFKGDAVETDEHGSLAITFIDGTAFTLAESARMVLNDMVYQPGGTNNSSLLSLVQGSITFVAGEVAHTGEMKVDTPVATMGIRGTAVHVNISAHNGPTRFSVMREPSGRVGSYILYDHKTGAPLATVAEVGNVVELELNNGQIVINTTPKTPLDFQQEQALTSQVFQTFQAGQQDSLLHALTQQQTPGSEHGSSGPPQTGPSGGQPSDSSHPDNLPTPPSVNSPPPPPPIFIPPPAPPHADPINPLPIVNPEPTSTPAPVVVPASAPTETIILTKNAAVESVLPVPSETVTSAQAANGNAVQVAANGTIITGLYGHLTIAADGSFYYVADHAAALGAGALGFDVFDYTVTNANGSTATATLTFDVIGASNNPIVATPVTAGTVSEKSAVQTINLLSGAASPNPNEAVTVATDGSGQPAVQVSVVSGPVNANAIVFSVDANGHLTIDPSQFSTLSSTQSETLSFSYTLTDASGGTTPQTATITIDGAPTVTYEPYVPIVTISPSISNTHLTPAIEAPTVTSATGDLVNLDKVALQAEGWTRGSDGNYTYVGHFGTATLVSTGVPYGSSSNDLETDGSFGVSITATTGQAPVNGEIFYQLTSTPPPGVTYDTFIVPYIDSLGGVVNGTATFTVSGLTPVITAPATATVGISQNDAISGISISELGNVSGEIFTVEITDTHGVLSIGTFNGPELITSSLDNSGPIFFTFSGTLDQVNAALANLRDTDTTPGSDTITISAGDSYNSSTQQTIAVTVNSAPTITAPSAQTIGTGQSASIAGISIAESGNTGSETFSATISDAHGLLSVTGSGGTVSDAGSTSLTISMATFSEMNTYLGSLTDTDTTPGSDTITITTTDSLGNSATQETIAVTTNGSPVITVPGPETIGVNQTTAITGIGLTESGNTSGELFSATISDTDGLLSVTGDGSGSVSGLGTTSLTITGVTLTELEAYRGSLTVTEASAGIDTITISATDSFGNSATQQTIDVTVNDVPVISVSEGNSEQTIGVGQNATISGISLSESGTTNGETFTVTLTDTTGALSVSQTAGVSGSGTNSLTLNGTLDQITADLATLHDTNGTPGSDPITLAATDSFGNSATQQTIDVTVNDVPVISVSEGSSAQTIGAGQNATISGVSLSESGTTDGGETFTVTVSDTHGTLSATDAVVSNSGTSLTLSGTLTQINNDLLTLTDTDATQGSDTITLNAHDSFGNYATQQTIAITANAQNLVTNGGFETGDLSDWTTNGYQTYYDHVQTYNVHSGNYSLEIGGVGGEFDLDQNVSTVAGQTYQVEFWLMNPGGTPSNFLASFGGVTLLSLTNSAGQPYTEYVYDVTATSSTTDLHFEARQDPSFWYLDDISVASIGALVVAANATLEINNAVAAGTTVTFSSCQGTLDLDNPANFHGQIAGIAGNGDVLDLSGFSAATTSATTGPSSFDSTTDTTALTITDSQQNISTTLKLSGDYSNSSWTVMSDGHGGVNIADPPAPAATNITQIVPSELSTAVETDGQGGDTVTLTGDITGSNEIGTIAWDQGASSIALNLTNGVFTASQDLAAGDHVATLTLTNTVTNAQTAQTIDIDIGGADAPFVFAPSTSPAVLVGSASANISQTLSGSATFQDTLVAGAGNDTLTGNYTGGDTFVFKTTMGNDQITDLHTGSTGGAHDVVDVSAFHFANYQALLAATTTDVSGDTTITLGTHTLTLDHVQKADLQSDLFHL